MRYLKKIFEAKKQLNSLTKKLLSDHNLTQDQYLDMIDLVGGVAYGEIKAEIPFLIRMIERDDLDINSIDIIKLINFYNKKKQNLDDMESTEDYFLDLIENSDGILVDFNKIDNMASFRINYSDLGDLGNKLVDIDKRFKRANKKYTIRLDYGSPTLINDVKVANLYLEIQH